MAYGVFGHPTLSPPLLSRKWPECQLWRGFWGCPTAFRCLVVIKERRNGPPHGARAAGSHRHAGTRWRQSSKRSTPCEDGSCPCDLDVAGAQRTGAERGLRGPRTRSTDPVAPGARATPPRGPVAPLSSLLTLVPLLRTVLNKRVCHFVARQRSGALMPSRCHRQAGGPKGTSAPLRYTAKRYSWRSSNH